MKKLLKELKKQKKVVCLYYDECKLERECTGYIKKVRGEQVLLARITDDGEADGYLLKSWKEICHVEVEHKFHKRIETLYQRKKESHIPLLLKKEEDLMTDVIRACEEMKLMVSVYIDSDDDEWPLTGFVSQKENMVEVKEIDQYGEPICVSYVHADRITTMMIEGIFEQSRHILYDNLKIQH